MRGRGFANKYKRKDADSNVKQRKKVENNKFNNLLVIMG